MSMYNNKLVASIKVNGKVLREFGEIVKLPFGSEYSIFLKNLNSVKAIVRLSIDGEDVAGDLVINANSSLDLERFIKNGNLDKGNRFKFIERTSKIEDHRGIQAEDGLLRIEYEFEKEPVKVTHEYIKRHYDYDWDDFYWRRRSWPYAYPYIFYNSGCVGSAGSLTDSLGFNILVAQNSMSLAGAQCSATMDSGEIKTSGSVTRSFNDAGITVPGSESNQKFTTVSGFPTDGIKHVIVLRLFGENIEGKPIIAPVTVKTKIECNICGTINKVNSKFCSECGSALEIL